MKAADFAVTAGGTPVRVVSVARLYRGPGAAQAAAWRKEEPADQAPRADQQRTVLFVVDQASLLPGDQMRLAAIADACLDLLGPGDRLGFATLPSASVLLPLDREAVRTAFGRVTPLRAVDDSVPAAAHQGEGRRNAPGDLEPDSLRKDNPAGGRVQPTRNLDDLLSVGKVPGTDTTPVIGAKEHAVAALAGLRTLLDAVRPVPGDKTILLMSAGLVYDDVSDQIELAAKGAATANTRIYTLQVPTPARTFAEAGQSGLDTLARASGGAAVRFGRSPGEALQSLFSELSFSYLLRLDPTVTSGLSFPCPLSVRSPRKGVTVRSGAWLAGPRPMPGEAPVKSSSAPDATPPVPSRGRDNALDVVLARATDYVRNYVREASALVAEEVYEQSSMSAGLGGAPRLESTRLVSDFLLVKIPGGEGWLPFRDVFEVDGQRVRDRDDRLQRLFLQAPLERAIENASAIWKQSARYNIGPLQRDLNVPTLALLFLSAENVGHFEFSRAGEERRNGLLTWIVRYDETARPTIITTSARENVRASGRVWIEPTSGRIVQTTLEAGSAFITVTYRPWAEDPELWLPASMDERYGASITGRATYSKIRRFTVITEEKIKKP